MAADRRALSDREQISRRLRLSVVRHCNFECFFCHNEGQGPLDPIGEGLSTKDLAGLCGSAMRAGIREIKLTGGEPLLYRSKGETIADLVRAIAERRRGHAVGISMTTNGLLLGRWAEDLRAAGLDRVTVSLHSLREETMRESVYANSTGDTVQKVIAGIRAAADAGLEPLKVNTVLFGPDEGKQGNVEELPELIETCRSSGVSELRLYTLLSHAGFHGREFRARYRFWDGLTLETIAAAVGDTAPRRQQVARAIEEFTNEWSSVIYPKPTLMLDADGLTVSIEAMAHDRFKESGLSAEGAYALRLSRNGLLRGSLESKRPVHLAKLLREGDEAAIEQAFIAARRELLPPEDSGAHDSPSAVPDSPLLKR